MVKLISYRTKTDNHTQHYDRKLARILRVAARVMAREGYEKASMRMVAREAKVGLSNLYYYVDGKEDLLFQIQLRTFSALVARLKEKTSTTSDPARKLYLMVENHLEHFLAHMDELKVCSRELESLNGAYYSKVLETRREYTAKTRRIIEELTGPRKGGADLNTATMCLFGMLNWIYMWYDPKKHNDAATLAKDLSMLFMKGYLPRTK